MDNLSMPDPEQHTSAPLPPVPTPVKTSDSSTKWFLGAVIVILAIISSFFGYSYKETTSELDTAKATIQDLNTKINTSSDSETTITPVLLGGKIAYSTVKKKIQKSHTTVSDVTNTTATTHSFQQTIEKKGNTLVGVGYGTDCSENLLIESDLIGPFGLASTASLSFSPVPSFKEAVLFLTYKP
jgi:hypothetical protein